MDETAVASMSLEPAEMVNPGAPAAETPPPAPETPPPPAPVAEDEPEGTIAAADGQKYVPLGAVKAERERRKEAEGKLTELEPLRQKAQKYDEAKDYLETARPYIEKARADLQRPQTPAVDPALEAEAIEYAKDFDLFTPEGKHDVARAMRIMKRNDERSAKQAQQAVSPILQTEAQRQSLGLYQHYLNQPEVNGVKVDPKFLAEQWQMVPQEISADPKVAQVLFINAIGRQILSGHKPISAPPPPLVTESVGHGRPSEVTLTEDSEKFLRASGMQPKEFKETRERYKPGQSNSLE